MSKFVPEMITESPTSAVAGAIEVIVGGNEGGVIDDVQTPTGLEELAYEDGVPSGEA